MESSEHVLLPVEEDSPEALPSLIKAITELEITGFDSNKEHDDVIASLNYSRFHPLSISGIGTEAASTEMKDDLPMPSIAHSVSISLPPSPIPTTKRVIFRDDDTILGSEVPSPAPTYEKINRHKKKPKFFSQPMPKGSLLNEAIISGKSANLPLSNPRIDMLRGVRSEKLKGVRSEKLKDVRIDKLKDVRYDSFKTWSGKLERQITNLRGKGGRETELNPQDQKRSEVETLNVDRYFDALEGPELDKLRASEEILLPEDQQWPFLLRFPVSSFGICLGVSSQAIMWKTLSSSTSTKFLHVSPEINLTLWLISVALVTIVAIIYALKLTFYFEAVRREYYHPIRVNFFFAPFIALLFLALGVPPSITQNLHSSLWYVLMTPFFVLELKIYGQWMSGGQRRLSKVANPSNHLSVVGNFVGALLGASMGLKEGPIFFFAIGMAHYTVLFVTLYQRLPTNETLPKELHPVFFLFVAAPSVASMAWARIQGTFDYGSRIAYFIALFLYFSLAVRVNFFRGFRFSLAWWAYTFPMTGAAIATIRYSNAVTNTFTHILTLVLCTISTLTVSALLITTIIHAFVLWDLFPNDIAIAISYRRPKPAHRRWFHKRTISSDNNIEKFLKYANSEVNDIETSIEFSNLQVTKDDNNGNNPSNEMAEP